MLVTDDEIVAAATLRNRRWQGALPSVDLSLPGSLVDAANRGVRSLQVRDLLQEEDALSMQAGDLIAAVDGVVRALVYVAEEERPLLPSGPSVAVIEANGSWLLDVTAPEGVHDLTRVDGSSAAWRAIETLMATAGDLPAARVLSVIAVVPDGRSGAFVSINGDQAITTPLLDPLPQSSDAVRAVTREEAQRQIREVFGA